MQSSCTVYHYSPAVARSQDFLLRVDDQESPVLRLPEADISIFSGAGPFAVEVSCFVRHPVKHHTIRPHALGIKAEVHGWKLRFTIPRSVPGVAVEIEGLRPLFLFPCPPETDVPLSGAPGVQRFAAGGVHDVGELQLNDGEMVYIEGGAVVRGCIRATNAHHVAVRGRGVLDGHHLPWVEQKLFRMLMAFDRCEDVLVEGITAIRPLFPTTFLGACSRAAVRGLHAVTDLLSTDGVGIIGSSDVEVEDCFLAIRDDCIVVKAADWSYSPPDGIGHWRCNAERIVARRCTLLNRGAGNVVEIGHETSCDRIGDVVFEDIDVLGKQGPGAVFALHHCDRAVIEDVTWQRVRVEHYFDKLFDLRIMRSVFADGHATPGPVRRLLFRDLDIARTPTNEGYSVSTIGGLGETVRIEDVTFERVCYNGRELQSLDELQLHLRHVGRMRMLTSAGERPTPRSLCLEELSTDEIRALVAAGWDTVLIPLASTEQHGPGLPLVVDIIHGRETCRRAARLLGQTLVGPSIPFGYAPQHLGFAGTIHLRPGTLAAVLEDVAASLARTGFRLVYFWISHAENAATLNEVLPELRARFPGSRIEGLTDVAGYVSATWNVMGAALGIAPAVAGSHAGEIETSMMLAAAPESVRMEAAAAGNLQPFDEIAERMMRDGMAAVSANGVLGDQRQTDARRGHAYLDLLAGYLANEVRPLQTQLGLRPA